MYAIALLGALLVVGSISDHVGRADPPGRWRSALRPRLAIPRPMRAAFLAAVPSLVATWALGGLILSLGGSLTAGVLGESSHLAAGLPIFIMTGVSAITAVQLRDTSAQATARGGLVALIVGVAVALLALAVESNLLFLLGGAIAGLGFGPAFAGVFRVLTRLAPVDQRAALISSVLTVSYLAFSLPALAAGAGVTDLGLSETAEVYGASLIALAALALALSGRLGDATIREPVTSAVAGESSRGRQPRSSSSWASSDGMTPAMPSPIRMHDAASSAACTHSSRYDYAPRARLARQERSQNGNCR